MVSIELRMDSAGAVPAIYDFCERERRDYTIGLISNPRLTTLAAPAGGRGAASGRRQRAGKRCVCSGRRPTRRSIWDHPRRVVIKAEALPKGPNTRFVVTTQTDAPDVLYTWYTQRGEGENWDQGSQGRLFRRSPQRSPLLRQSVSAAAACRGLLGIDPVRHWLITQRVARMQLDTLRLRLLKIGGRVWQWSDRVRLRLAVSHPGQPLWDHLAASCHLHE